VFASLLCRLLVSFLGCRFALLLAAGVVVVVLVVDSPVTDDAPSMDRVSLEARLGVAGISALRPVDTAMSSARPFVSLLAMLLLLRLLVGGFCSFSIGLVTGLAVESVEP
jgi:hypothetical protein